MKKLCLLMLCVLFQINAHANNSDADIAQDAFMNDESVKAALTSAQENNFRLDDEVGVLYLKGSCGFAGCFDTYLVSVGMHQNRVINPQSQSVIAKVILMNARPYTIELLDCDKL